ncbi:MULTISPECIES: hypothetical protein [Actinosynnema]|uniref:Uncharacterized protein n=1 Tax=Actinosynnema pretiosum TaxID=42197 RepID=A0A290Z6Z0_9PSEU|nr:hypothetical protein [Actinosynnema pretiosum]ATE54790.1 hypothetical protein CNX65_17135 [Actinosynnema pretiosum]
MAEHKRLIAVALGLLSALALIASLLPGTAGAAEARDLRARAEAYLVTLGPDAVRVAPDRIEAPGVELLLAGPDERAIACPYYNFCAYSLRNFEGDLLLYEDCRYALSMPWFTTDGSWKNNQTPGRRARINYLRGTHWDVPGAYSEQSSGMGWDQVGTIDPC